MFWGSQGSSTRRPSYVRPFIASTTSTMKLNESSVGVGKGAKNIRPCYFIPVLTFWKHCGKALRYHISSHIPKNLRKSQHISKWQISLPEIYY